jgi:hypothetical protein
MINAARSGQGLSAIAATSVSGNAWCDITCVFPASVYGEAVHLHCNLSNHGTPNRILGKPPAIKYAQYA